MKIIKKIISFLIFLTILMFILFISVGSTYTIMKNIPYNTFASISYKFGIILGILYILYKIFNKENLKLKDIIIILLSIFGYFSYKYALNQDYALNGFINRCEGLYMLLTYYIIFLTSSTLNKKYQKILMTFLLLTGVYQVFIGSFQFRKHEYIFNYYRAGNFSARFAHASGSFGNPNFYSTYILICLVYSLYNAINNKIKPKAFIYFIFSIYFLYGLIIGDTLSCIISFIIILGLMLVKKINKNNYKKVIIILLTCIFISFLVISISDKFLKTKIKKGINKNIDEVTLILKNGINDDTGQGRIYVWKKALEISKDNLINGIGIDNFGVVEGDYYLTYINPKGDVKYFDKVHNEYLQILVTEGVFTLATYVFLLIYVIYKYKKNKDIKYCLYLCFIGYLIQAISNISVIEVAPIFYMIMGFIINEEGIFMKNEDIIKIENLRNKKDTYYIRWNMTRLCNYHCDFCIQGNTKKHIEDSKGESKKIRKEICDKLINFIENNLKKYKKVKIYLIGGEVTILPDFYEILQKLVNIKFNGHIEFQITTNLSCDKELLLKIKELFKNKNNRRLSISASFYKTFTNESEFIEKIKLLYPKNRIYNYICKSNLKLQNSKLIKKLGNKEYNNLNISIGYPIANDKDYKEFKKFRRKNFFKCNSLNYIVIRKYKTSISDRLKEKLNRINIKTVKVTLKGKKTLYFTNNAKMNLAIIPSHRFNPNGMYCDIGINSMAIDSLGNVSRCQSCAKETFVYNILKHDIVLFKNMIKCPNNCCDCNYYNTIERKKHEK